VSYYFISLSVSVLPGCLLVPLTTGHINRDTEMRARAIENIE
jgi:hypothetical protein